MKQQGLFPEAEVQNESSNEVWKRSEVDRLLDLYFEGASPDTLASQLKRNRKAVTRKLQEYIYNERDRVINYKAKQRNSRRSKRLTFNEKQLIEECRKKGVDWEPIARVLCRTPEEIGMPSITKSWDFAQLKKASTGVDLIMSYRYLYYVKGKPLLTDKEYDDLEAEEVEYGAGGEVLKRLVGSDREEDYPPHIRALALYLAFKHMRRESEPERCYGIGEETKPGEYGMWHGPVGSLEECLKETGKSENSVIVKLSKKANSIVLRRWDNGKWKKTGNQWT